MPVADVHQSCPHPPSSAGYDRRYASEKSIETERERSNIPPQGCRWETAAHPRTQIVAILHVFEVISFNFIILPLECGGNERTRVFTESFLGERERSARAAKWRKRYTDLGDLKNLFELHVRLYFYCDLCTHNPQARPHRDRREDARIPAWLIMRLSLGFESSGSAIATGGKG